VSRTEAFQRFLAESIRLTSERVHHNDAEGWSFVIGSACGEFARAVEEPMKDRIEHLERIERAARALLDSNRPGNWDAAEHMKARRELEKALEVGGV